VSRIGEILQRGRAERLFSGAAWSVGTADAELDGGCLGTLAWDGDPVSDDTLWDLASVTKPIAGLALMALIDDGHLLLDDPIARYLPEFTASDKAVLTIRELLTHTSGIPGQIPLYRWCHTPAELVAAIRDVPVAHAPGQRVIYSSQGFIVLGLVAEALTETRLDKIIANRVTGPAGMSETRFRLSEADQTRAAATEDCPWRGRLVQGTVHDENAEVMGGVAAHAGLFAPIADLARLGKILCRGGGLDSGAGFDSGRPLLSPAAFTTMITPATDHLPLRRCLAWQGRDRVNSPAGDLLGPRAYGHTGFTGTSLWADPELGGYVALVTNRVHPARESRGFDRVRRVVHNVAARMLSTAS
jgi:CubicO group peptidase (beta-lactamase class C family)